MDLPPVLRQMVVKTQSSSNGELVNGIVSPAVHEREFKLAAVRRLEPGEASRTRPRTCFPATESNVSRNGGSQYASSRYTELLKENGIGVSMSRQGNPWDNAKRLQSAIGYVPSMKFEANYAA